MLRILFLFMLLLHGAIHVLGFVKAFRLGAVAQLSKDISKPMGCLSLLAAALFVLVAVLMLLKKDWWWIPGLLAVIVSQMLLFSSWGDARFGSIPNAIILIVNLLSGTAWRFEQGYCSDVKTLLLKNEAPATLIDSRISWEAIDDTSSRATFTNEGQSIQATLYFNTTGQLVNFVSDDRYAASDMKRYRFSTPVGEYKNFHGFNVMSFGETIWHYPDGEFVYGKFELQEIVYNVAPL